MCFFYVFLCFFLRLLMAPQFQLIKIHGLSAALLMSQSFDLQVLGRWKYTHPPDKRSQVYLIDVSALNSLYTHRGNILNIFSPMTFWSNTGEALRRQPDNYYGLQVSKYKFKYKYCVTFNEQTNTNTNINHSTAILRPAI